MSTLSRHEYDVLTKRFVNVIPIMNSKLFEHTDQLPKLSETEINLIAEERLRASAEERLRASERELDMLLQNHINTQQESDPLGKDQHEQGAKLDSSKTRLGLVLLGFAKALEEVGKVGTFGANKYTDNGWGTVPNGQERYTDAMLRHIFSEASGEDVDQDSGLLHASHAAWNALARLELILNKKL